MAVIITILLVLLILAGLFALYLLIVALLPGFPTPEQSLAKPGQAASEATAAPPGRQEVSFAVKGTNISAWLYLPQDRSAPVPCIVMAHGFGGTKDMGLELYALPFQQAGYAVLAFDYRYFGDSGGQPRQLMWIPYQLQDWAAAVAYARGLKQVDPARIALWGTSASGGHVIVIAAQDHDIACAVAQCPGLDGRASGKMLLKRQGLWSLLRLMPHGQRDMVRSWLRLSPHRIPIVGKPGNIAMLADADAFDAFGRSIPDTFVNQICARIILRADHYRPVKHARKVRCPVLLLICDRDNIIPLSAALETEKNLGQYAEAKHYDIGHFDIYSEPYFERSLADQLDFFKRHLG